MTGGFRWLLNKSNGKKCSYLRPPYSNNTIPIYIEDEKTYEGSMVLYDISNNNFTPLNIEEYFWYFSDSDRAYCYFHLSSPDWWLTNESWSYFYLILKNNIPLYEVFNGYTYNNVNIEVLDYIHAEFAGTVFDDEYIMETIRNVNNSGDNIITLYGIVMDDNLDDPSESNYFIERMESYFGIDIQNEFIDTKSKFSYNTGIYRDGFYVHNEEKIVILDLKNKTTKIYLFDEFNQHYKDDKRISANIIISNDTKTMLLRVFDWDGINDIIYKYEL
jgi:hypothetical protein